MKRSLSKAERLRKGTEFRQVFSSASKQSCLGAKLSALPNSLDKPRFGVGLSKKFGNAVERNHAKRQVREIFRLHKHRVKPGYDLVFLIFPGPWTYREREEQFLRLLERAGLRQGAS